MLLLRACPHCHGDLVVESDRRCAYLVCVQCGHTLSREQERALGLRVTRQGLAHLVPRAARRQPAAHSVHANRR